jgi:hypothetical protein
MLGNAHRMPGGALQRSLLRAALALAIAILVSLLAHAKAEAADCMSWDACYGSAQWEKMIANQRFNEGVFYGKAADQAAARGDTAAANLYRAASTQKLNEAQLHNIAFDQLIDRGMFIAGGIVSDGDYPAAPGVDPGGCEPGAAGCTAKSGSTSCRSNLLNEWHPKVHGKVIYNAIVSTKWCWRGGEIVSRSTNYGWHGVSDHGSDIGIEEQPPMVEPHSGCHDFVGVHNYNCIVRIQYRFTKTSWCWNVWGGFRCTRHYGGCIGTRIYGDRQIPNYSRNHYNGDCKTTD